VKGPAVTVHWRRAPAAQDWAEARAAELASGTGLRAHPGRMSIELRPAESVDKGSVVRRLAAGMRAAAFFGDDLGDLPAFAELGRMREEDGRSTVGVAVVDDETAPEVLEVADLTVRGPSGALSVLRWLAADPTA
jgi:trehalose 6-phosphate phosphatase